MGLEQDKSVNGPDNGPDLLDEPRLVMDSGVAARVALIAAPVPFRILYLAACGVQLLAGFAGGSAR